MDGRSGGAAITFDDHLSLRVARRATLRLRRARRSLPASRPALFDQLADALRALPKETRARVLAGPDIRGFLTEVETWVAVRGLALALRAGRRQGRSGFRRVRGIRIQARLFERISATQYLTLLVPRGRIDASFPARCLAFARKRLDDAVFDLAALVLGLRLVEPRSRPLRVSLRFREEAEQGRPGDRIELGTIAGASGPLAIRLVRARRSSRSRPAAPRVRGALRGATLILKARGAPDRVVPAAGTPLIAPDLEAGRRARPGRRGVDLRLIRRCMIPGTPIVLAPVVESTPRRLRVTREDADIGRRLARAIRVLRVAWPQALREIERRTFMVVPIREAGTVSYSMAGRPGISFINVFGKSILDLADDLLHETAHHRLHDLEETVDLVAAGPEAREIQAFDSPWRGTRRPLRGVLHGAYTFLFRAEMFERLLHLDGRRRLVLGADFGRKEAAFARRELRREREMITGALRDLGAAGRSGLMTAAGRRLLREMRARLERLRR